MGWPTSVAVDAYGNPLIAYTDGTNADVKFAIGSPVPADSDSDGVPDGDDNCPDTPNPNQENNVHPGTPEGDHCEDPDADLVFDIADNCPDDSNSDQTNTDVIVNPPGDGLGDACDPDDDDDSWVDDDEAVAGTDPLDNCTDQPDDNDAWPPDVASGTSGCGTPDTDANILDVSCYKPKLPPNPYDPRYDLDASGEVNILDVLWYKPVLGMSCINP